MLDLARKAASITTQASRFAGRRARIAQVVPSLRVGGLEKVVLRLVESLGERFEHVVITPSADGPLRPRFPRGVRVIPMAEQHPSDKWNALRMARLFRDLRPDIVHSRNWTCIDAVVGARLAGVPVVVHGEHGRDASDPEGKNRLRRGVRRVLAPLVTEFVTVSRDLARWLVEDVRVPARKVSHICNGVDTDRFRPAGGLGAEERRPGFGAEERRVANDREAARRALGIPEGAFVVGTVGRFDPVKDHVGLVRAFAEVGRDRLAVLVIAGDGPCRDDVARVVASEGLEDRVRLLGERADVEYVLRSFDIFVLPSLGEGISNTILEAMATGLPVVATRVGGNPELVTDDETGALVPPRSPHALVAAMGRYLDDPARVEAHGLAARRRAQTQFGLVGMLQRYESLYVRLLSGRAVR